MGTAHAVLTRYLFAPAMVLCFCAGWLVDGWRHSGEIAELGGTIKTHEKSLEQLRGANAGCRTALDGVKGAVREIAEDAKRRSAAAAAAMQRAEKKAAEHLEAARAAGSRPMPEPGGECEQLAREAVDYAAKRRGEP